MTDLPNRRHALTYRFEQRGHCYYGTIGIDPRSFAPCEIFLQAGKAGSELEAVARDAAVLASLALQYGCPIEAMRSAMTRLEANAPAGPVGALLDIFETDMARRASA